jgi:hypothetical protein
MMSLLEVSITGDEHSGNNADLEDGFHSKAPPSMAEMVPPASTQARKRWEHLRMFAKHVFGMATITAEFSHSERR